ncbi:RelA/SpoT family protein [Alloprevotella tannerae]|uniref:RelA/SpoT family protein n=2 Tax=Alloprevotella tannerae TaxID=76122 RepID=C9LFQ3_9BACT|nr:RelA/SpoT family protein [Alloprevotella tannerae]EEX71511.1 RelA/SpoT family protein [Alloprevotella tannerae ATCC 51259]
MDDRHLTLTPQEQKDEELIQAAFQHLLDTYLATSHRKKVEIITKAFNFAKQAHKGVRRLSGEPYILHPIAVAQIACEEIGLGSTSICAALLHDVEEDTDYTNEDIANLFGPKVADIVEGLTKINRGVFGDRDSLQAETFKKLLLTMSDDIRVILIKISDRLHNMRTLASMAKSRQYKIAGETLYIYAPLADRLGLNKIKTELEDLSFRYELPEEYEKITQLLANTQEERKTIFDSFVGPIRAALDKMGFKYAILQRIKSPYSIWCKMQNKHVVFKEIYDILAIRIIYTPLDRSKEIDECFSIYGALTQIYKPHPTRFRDWLSTPKANGYQALHNTFMSNDGKWIEVQIRSDRMDDIAEQGFAAHWKYKDKEAEHDESELDKWLDSIKEILDDPQPDTLDLLDTIKLNLFSKEILVFTPKGEIKTMPNNATVLDFAFSIHTFLGAHCFGAKVNHKLVPLSYRLKSGDQVEILTSNTQHAQAEWLNFATTAKARGKIQAILRHEKREVIKEGEAKLKAFLKKAGLELSASNLDKLTSSRSYMNKDEFLYAIGNEKLSLSESDLNTLLGKTSTSGWRRYVPFMNKKAPEPQILRESDFLEGLNHKKILTITDEILSKSTMATCCHPIPGDDVLGYITPQKTLEIHLRNCPVATKLKTRFGNNIVATKWDTHKVQQFPAAVYIRGVDSQGVLHTIADTLSSEKSYVLKRITLDTNDGIFEGKLEFLVNDTKDLKRIITNLQKLNNVEKAYRIEDITIQ